MHPRVQPHRGYGGLGAGQCSSRLRRAACVVEVREIGFASSIEDKHVHPTRLSLVWLDVGRGLSSAVRSALQ
jgi:hypothetical protein